jgi:hypothetical protein
MMNYKKRFDQLVEFLEPIKNLWAKEVLEYFPSELDIYNSDWIEFLNSLDNQTLWKVDCQSDYSLIEDSEFGQWLKKIRGLCEVDKMSIDNLDKLPDWAFFKVKEKKRHEILKLSKVLKKIQSENNFKHLVDIGGGVGHLSRTLAHYYGINCISLDINSDFQEIGKKRLEKYPLPAGAKDVHFINHDFSTELGSQLNQEIFTQDSFSLGLHTCGPLANHHIKAALKNNTKGFINFGCCYNRLDPLKDTNISEYGKSHGITFSEYSMTLASRGHSSMTFEDFEHKRRVKFYRYALQLYLEQYENKKEMVAVGETHARVYWSPFCEYTKERLAHLGLQPKLSDTELNEFFLKKEHQEILNKMFLANVIRWQLGAPLELYILLDRVLYLEEQGKSCELKQVFDQDLSPRNHAIICK